MTPTDAQRDAARMDRAALAREAGPAPDTKWAIMRYDTDRWPFAQVLSRDVYKVRRLDRLHVYLLDHKRRARPNARLTARDNVTVTRMMEDQPQTADFWKLYHAFMLHRLAPTVGRGISYTQRPKMRVHLHDTRSVSSFHHDICVTKRIDQINFWMPFVDVDGGSTIWLESDYGLCDFRPIPVRYGEILIWDGGYLGHGSVDNNSGRTRVSLDMRFSFKKAKTRAQGVELMNHLAKVLGAAEPAGPPLACPSPPLREHA